jgi:hypothetical protein
MGNDMNAVLKPIGFGVAAYAISAVCLWFVFSYVLTPVMPGAIWVLPAVLTLVPLFLSGYVASRSAISNPRSRKVALGVVAGLIGYGITLVITQAQGEGWLFVLLFLGAATVSAIGSFLGARQKNVP